VPVAGQHAVGVEHAFHQGIALVRTAVVAGMDLALMEEQRDMLALEFHGDRPRGLQPIEFDRADPSGHSEVVGSSAIDQIPAPWIEVQG
jgi:hypothetical protein